MDKKKHSPKSLLNIKFDVSLNGYSPLSVDKVFDEIIEDYLLYEKEIKDLKQQISSLKNENSNIDNSAESNSEN